jgi:hypothetical protein
MIESLTQYINRGEGCVAYDVRGQGTLVVCPPGMGDVHVPTLVVMGTKDPDFPDPAAEAGFIADATGGQVLLVQGAGHYPHAELPDDVVPGVLALLGRTAARA